MARHTESNGKSTEVDSTTDKVQRRRIMKHMVEKRRRNRINDTLEKMRILVLKAMNKNPENYTKMEKLDIMEMATNFLYMLNQQRTTAHANRAGNVPDHVTAAPHVNHSAHGLQYCNGYATCQNEINNFLKTYESQQHQNFNNAHISNKMIQHLGVHSSTQITPNEHVMFSPIMQSRSTVGISPLTSTPRSGSDVCKPLHVTTSFHSNEVLDSSLDNVVTSSTCTSKQSGLLCTVSTGKQQEESTMDINVEDISTVSTDSGVWRPW